MLAVQPRWQREQQVYFQNKTGGSLVSRLLKKADTMSLILTEDDCIQNVLQELFSNDFEFSVTGQDALEIALELFDEAYQFVRFGVWFESVFFASAGDNLGIKIYDGTNYEIESRLRRDSFKTTDTPNYYTGTTSVGIFIVPARIDTSIRIQLNKGGTFYAKGTAFAVANPY